LSFALTALVSVILLVNAMKLRQLRIVVGQCACHRIGKALSESTAQMPARCFDPLNVAQGSGH
jgi:hypothetical protein